MPKLWGAKNLETGNWSVKIISYLLTALKVPRPTSVIWLSEKYNLLINLMPLKLLESNLDNLLLFICNTRSKLFRAKFLPDISVNALWDTFNHNNRPKLLKNVGCIFSNPLWDRSKYSNWFWALKVFWKGKVTFEYKMSTRRMRYTRAWKLGVLKLKRFKT